ncbi:MULTISPECIES: amidohydrolase family protein [unclassified Robiginitalea]|uniref:amidohydrolase family protein n=1 Tax=Robiginitalea TaxID=252306 RepID=UPI002349E3A6|nr:MULTISPECIES: amidohydrolase family protein [unclassified Robiginitalea]MDC6354060.1 amidohydrolase family protein [Robiginitalea sp. PM2]MDC6374327.1 amidohydrolase family protein [Robiginitalea sp. SP8]
MMQPKHLLTLCTALLTYLVNAQEMGFEQYNPTSTLVVPAHPTEQAKFPFIDMHSHHFRMPTQDLSELVAAMDSLNMAVMVNLSGGSGDHLRGAVANVRAHYPNRFVVFANVDFDSVGAPGWGQRAAAQLEADVENGASGLKIYKSLGLRNTDINGDRVAVDDPRLDPIWEKCAELGIPVLIHSADPRSFWDPMDSLNERWLELKLRPRRKRSNTDPAPWQQIIDEQHRVFKKHPNTRFVNAHMGWYANDLDTLSDLLDEMPNMYVGIGAVIAELGRQPRRARKFFIDYQDRVVFGKDAWQPSEYPTYFRVLETDDEYFPYYKKYHAFWAMYGLDLPDDVLRKLYYENALKLLPGLDTSLFPDR